MLLLSHQASPLQTSGHSKWHARVHAHVVEYCFLTLKHGGNARLVSSSTQLHEVRVRRAECYVVACPVRNSVIFLALRSSAREGAGLIIECLGWPPGVAHISLGLAI